jgi:hypothetical protein
MRNLNFIIILFPYLLGAQNVINGTIVDTETLKPLEFVDVYTNQANTSSNAEGKFEITTNGNEVSFTLLGYEKKISTLKEINGDTIFLKNKFVALDEVLLSTSGVEPIIQMYRSIPENYPSETYSEEFFMRCLLKKDGAIVKLQDLSGLIERKMLFSTSKNPMPRNNYTVEIQNMRKASVKEEDIYFEMFSMNEFLKALIATYMSPELYDFETVHSTDKDQSVVKYYFTPKPSSNLATNGFYLVNPEDKAFNQYYMLNSQKNKKFTEKRRIKYRTYFYELDVRFKSDTINKKYYLNKAKLSAKVELINKESDRVLYDVEYQWFTSNHGNVKVDDNFSMRRDLFKIDKDYNPQFWNNQNQLLLTSEMKSFLQGLTGEDKSEFVLE